MSIRKECSIIFFIFYVYLQQLKQLFLTSKLPGVFTAGVGVGNSIPPRAEAPAQIAVDRELPGSFIILQLLWSVHQTVCTCPSDPEDTLVVRAGSRSATQLMTGNRPGRFSPVCLSEPRNKSSSSVLTSGISGVD